MKIIAVRDSKSRGYTVYHEDFPEVIAQVENLKDANQRLADTFKGIMMHSQVEE